MLRSALLPPILALALAPALGCGKLAQEAATQSGLRAATDHDLRVDRADGRVTTVSRPGTVRIVSGEGMVLPGDFPSDVYLPPDHRLLSVMELNGTTVLRLAGPGPAAALQDAASLRMQEQGWAQTMALNHEQARMLSFEKQGRSAMVTVHPAEDGRVQFHVHLALASL